MTTQMYLEAERARLLRELMRLRESKGDIAGAAAASRELQVEVCNSLSSREKAEFLLEQVGVVSLWDLVSSESCGVLMGSRSADDSEGERACFEGGRDGGSNHDGISLRTCWSISSISV